MSSELTRGDEVREGQVIGEVDDSGRTTGPHLHYMHWVDREVVDPEEIIESADPYQYQIPAVLKQDMDEVRRRAERCEL